LSTARTFGFPGATPSISASSDSANGVLWVLDNSNLASSTGQLLFAYDAGKLSSLIYSSQQAANGRDAGGGAVKFTVPTVANGKVYVAGQTTLTVYGLLP